MVLAWHFRLEWGQSISATGFQRQVALANHDGFGYIAALLPDGGDRKKSKADVKAERQQRCAPPRPGLENPGFCGELPKGREPMLALFFSASLRTLG
jgi:hypothetical protein